MKNKLLFKKATSILFWSFALLFLLVSGKVSGQVTVFNYQNTTATIPTGWTLTNNVATNVIDKSTYLLLDPGNPSDQIVTPNYDLTGYTNVALAYSVATFGTVSGNPALKVEVSTNGGTSWSPTTYTSSVATSSTYVNGSLSITGQTFTSTTKFRLSNILTTGTSLRNQSLKLTGTVSLTAPTAPTITGINPSNGQLSVAFTVPSSNGGSAITDYKYSKDGGTTYVSSGSTTSPIVITGLTNGTTYSLLLKAVNSVGDGTASNALSGTPRTSPSAPTITTITPSNNQLSIAFTSGFNGGSTILNYKYSLDGGSTFTSAGSTTSPIVVTGLTNGNTYNVQLLAVNAAGDGTPSSTTSATVYAAPSAVNSFSVTAGNAQLSLAFTAPSSNGGSVITDYQYSLNGGSTFTSAGTTTSPIVVTGLTNGTTYQVQIRAVNAAGSGVSTSSVSATPKTTATAPSISAITAGNSQLTVAFTAPSSNGGSVITDYKYSLNGGSSFVSVGTTSSPIVISGLTNGTTYNIQILAVNVVGDGSPSTAVQGTPVAPSTPTLSASKSSVVAFSTTYGTASNTDNFTVSGSTLIDNITIAAPTGFEVSTTSSTSGFATSQILIQSSGSVASTTVYVRLSASNTVANSPYSGNIVLSSTGATNVNVATVSSTVSAKVLTISGLTGNDKTYDGTASATVSGSATLVGVINSDNVTLNSSAASYSFADATAGTNKSITVLGFTLNGTAIGNYSLAQPLGLTATINKANQTIVAISTSEIRTFGDATYSAATTADSGLTVTYTSSNSAVATVSSSGVVTLIGAGSATITVSQSGNANYNAATSLAQGLTVNKADQTITAIASTATKTFGDATYSVATTASSGLAVTYSSDNTSVATVSGAGIVTIVGAGSATISASQSGNGNYNAAVSVIQSLTVNKANQTITLAATDSKTTATTTYALTQNASSGLAITYTSSNAAVATVLGNTVTIVGAGTTTITANQVGNTNYNAASQVTQTLTVAQAPVVLAGWDFTGIGSVTNTIVAATTFNSGLVATSGANNISRGAGAAWSTAANSYRTAGFQNNGLATTNTDYFQTTLTPASGKIVSLSAINSNLSGTASFTVSPGVSSQFAYSLNGTTFTLIGSPIVTVGNPATLSIDVSGITALQNVPAGTTVTLRYYASGQTTTGGWGFISSASGTNGLAISGFVSQIPAPSITSSLAANGTVGTSFSYTTIATNSPTSYAATGLPSGLSISSSTGIISGTPSVGGTFNVSLSATNGTGTDTKTLVVTIAKSNQTITFNSLATKTYGDATFNLTGTASSGLTVTYSSSNTAVATISGNTVTIVGTGTTTITASQAGNDNYNAAADVTQNLVVNKANQTITFNTLSDKNDVDGSFTLAATASSGLSVSYISSNTSVVTISGNTVTIIAPGTATITASQLGNDNYNAATSVDQSQTIINTSLINQTITFSALSPVTYGDATFTLNATIDSSLAVTYVSSNPSVASVSGNVVTILTPGTTIITASQAGDSTHNPASNILQTLLINKKALTVSNVVVADKSYDGTTTATITTGDLNGIVGSDNVTLSNAAVFTSANAGTDIAVTPNFILNGVDAVRYELTQPSGLIATITKVNQSITFGSLSPKTYGDATFTLSATGGNSGLPIVFTSSDTSIVTIFGNVVTVVGAGTVTITASQAGNTNYNAATDVAQTLVVNKANQTITFNALVNRTTVDTSFTLSATSTSALAVTYVSSNTSVATISGNVVTIVGAGTTIITASQAGNGFYNPATDINQTQVVLTAISKWTFEGITTAGTASSPLVSGSAVADQGLQTTGSLFSATHASTSTVWSNPSGNGTTKSVSSTFWAVGDYYQYKLNSSNYYNLAISVDQTGSSTGPSTFKVQYSTNGSTFTDLPGGTYTLDSGGWSATNYRSAATKSFDLSALVALNNKSAVYIRLVDANTTSIGNGTVASGGSSRVDNFALTGIVCNTVAAITNNTNTNVLTCDTNTIAVTASGGSSYSWSNGTSIIAASADLNITAGGTYTVTVTSTNGCSSTANVVITENKNTTSEETQIACDSYTWNGTTYTTSGDKTFTSTNASGCVNVATLHLTINNSTTTSETQVACDSYTWNGTTYTTSGDKTFTSTNASGCPNVATLHLTINNSATTSETQVACDSYTWNGTTYTTSGDKTFTSTNASGCPNVATLHLTINNSATVYTDADGDGYSVGSQTMCYGATVPTGYSLTSNGSDCNDADASAHVTATYYVDADADGFDAGSALFCLTTAPSGYSATTGGTDCNDAVYSATNTCTSVVNVKLNIQGYYDAATHAMRAVLANQGVGASATDVDDVTVELRDSSTNALVTSVVARLHTDGTAVATFTTAPIGSFYIAVRHRNALETWSAAPQTVGATPLTYDFTTAANKAYGDNMVQLESGVYGIYSGDINHDGLLDLLDYPQLFNDSDSLLEGYQATDLNGDGFVDLLDYPILFNNSDNLIETLHP